MPPRPPSSTLFPYTTLFRSRLGRHLRAVLVGPGPHRRGPARRLGRSRFGIVPDVGLRSEEHTSELQSHSELVCRLLLEKKNGGPDAQVARGRWPDGRMGSSM